MTSPDRPQTGHTPPPSLWDHLQPQDGSPPPRDPWATGTDADAAPTWTPSATPPWTTTTWDDGSGRYATGSSPAALSPFAPAPSRPRRGRRVAAVVAALAVAGALAVGAGFVTASDDAGLGTSVADEPPYFFPEAARPVTGDTALGLALGTPVVAVERPAEGERARELRVEPSAALRQVAVAASPYDSAPDSGRYLLVDVAFTPVGGAAAPGTNDFTLLLPNGAVVPEAATRSGWYDLFPSAFEDAWDGPRTGTLVFDLPVGQDALLVYGSPGRTLASWSLPAGPAPVVDAATLPGAAR